MRYETQGIKGERAGGHVQDELGGSSRNHALGSQFMGGTGLPGDGAK
jgi:hypothetical protein